MLGERIGSDREKPFNANPTLAGYALGLAAAAPEDFTLYRDRLGAALGSLGDRMVLGLLRPLSVALGLIAAAAGPVHGAAALLLVYNPPELYLRWRALRSGLGGLAVVTADLGRDGLAQAVRELARVSGLAVAAAGGFCLAGLALEGGMVPVLVGLLLLPAAALLLRGMTASVWRVPLVSCLLAAAWLTVTRLAGTGAWRGALVWWRSGGL